MFKEKIIKLGACDKAVSWVKGRDLQAAWRICRKPHWMIWGAMRMAGEPGWSSKEEVVSICCDIVENCLKLLEQWDGDPKEFIELARKWTRGEVTTHEIRLAEENSFGIHCEKVSESIDGRGSVLLAGSKIAYEIIGVLSLVGDDFSHYPCANSASDAILEALESIMYLDTEDCFDGRKEKMCDLIRAHLTIGTME